MTSIEKLEQKLNRKYHADVTAVLEKSIQTRKPIQFKVPGYWDFQTLNFHSEQSLSTNYDEITEGEPEGFAAMGLKKIEDYLSDYQPVILPTNLLPFARNTYGDKTLYLYFEADSNKPILVDVDHSQKKPVHFDFTINELLPVQSLIEFDNEWKFSRESNFHDLVQPQQYFSSVPDGIWDANSYRELFEANLALIGKPFEWNFEPVAETEDHYEIKVQLNKKQGSYILQKSSHYVDSIGLLKALNDLLTGSGLLPNSAFEELSYDHFDFGIVLVDKELLSTLKLSGHIKYKAAEYSQEEKNKIEEYQNRLSQLKNLLFIVDITMPELVKEHKGKIVYLAMEIESELTESDLNYLLKDARIKSIEKEDGQYYFVIQVPS